MEPNHDEIWTNEDPETHDYWEAGITSQAKRLSKAQRKNIQANISKDDGQSQTRIHRTEEWEEVPKRPIENPIEPDNNTRKEQESAKELTIQRNYLNTVTL